MVGLLDTVRYNFTQMFKIFQKTGSKYECVSWSEDIYSKGEHEERIASYILKENENKQAVTLLFMDNCWQLVTAKHMVRVASHTVFRGQADKVFQGLHPNMSGHFGSRFFFFFKQNKVKRLQVADFCGSKIEIQSWVRKKIALNHVFGELASEPCV